MKAWSRAQHAQEREAGLYAHHQAEAELISSYLNSHQAVEAAVAAVSSSAQAQQQQQSYGGVPIPPPLVPGQDHLEEHHPLPPQRSTSASGGGSSGQQGQRSRGKRSRHAGTSSRSSAGTGGGGTAASAAPIATAGTGDIHYPKYDLYGHNYKYAPQDQCQYTTKYGEDCHFNNQGQYSTSSKGGNNPGGSQCAYNKTWPKQHCTDEEGQHYTQDDQQVQYVDTLDVTQMPVQQTRSKKKKHRDRSPQQLESYPCFSSREREYLVSTGASSRHYIHETQSKAAHDPIPAIEEVGRYIEQAENRAKSVKDIARDLAKDRAVLAAHQESQQTTADQQHQSQHSAAASADTQATEAPPTGSEPTTINPETIPPPPQQPEKPSNTMESSTHTLQTFNPQASTKAEVQLQQEHIQYVDNECCQVAVGVVTSQGQPGSSQQTQDHVTSQQAAQQQAQQQAAAAAAATLPRSRQPGQQSKSKTGTLNPNAQMTTASQFATLERNMAEVAERNRQSRAELQNQANTLGRQSRYGDSCDTCDAPLTPASLAGIDHRDLEHRPLTRSVTRATVYDEPPERTSLFITISGLYGLFLFVVCIAFLASEIATHSVPLHYFEGLFTYLYIVSILFLLYVFCFLLHEYSCCSGPPTQPTVRNAYFHNLPRDALPDGSPVREKLANFKRPKKFKTSENDFSHGSFFLRIGGIAFGLGTMIYNGMELGTFFEIPWTSPCYQVLRGINPILQMVFTFSQMYFVFMNARLNIHKFKCVARFGLMHIVATNLCVWMRTVVKECTKEIAQYRVNRGQGVSEDYMILEGYNTLRRKFGSDSFLVNGPYSAIMSAFTPPDGSDGLWGFNIPGFSDQNEGPMSTTLPSTAALAQALAQAPPQQNYAAAPYYSQTIPPMGGSNNMLIGNRFANNPGGVINLANNFTCGRNSVMGNIVTYASPYLYPFVVEYSLIGAAVVYAMWRSIGSNPRYRGEDDDRMSIASRKMTAYAKTDCIGASKGLFFGLITLVLGVISLILFFVLIDNDNKQIGKMAVFLADISHCAILLVSILAIFLGFLRVQKLKFHGEDQSVLGDVLLRFAAIGMFAYSTFNIVAGILSVHTDPKNLLIMAVGGISIIQVMLQLLFITDAQRRRIHSNDHNSSKPGRQVVTFLLICNITMWIIFTFEVQKVKDSPVQLRFFGFYAWSMIQRICLPLCIFFRFHSSVILVEIWKNSYKTKLMD